MRASAFAAALLLAGAFSACRNSAPKDGAALYVSKDGALSCRAPQGWRVLEGLGGAQRATFLGPPAGPRPFSQSVGLYFYGKGSAFSSPEDFARGQRLAGGETTPLSESPWKGEKAWRLTTTRKAAAHLHSKETEERVEQAALIPRGDGFYAVIYSSPRDEAASGEPVFAGVLDSLTLRN